jgi:hypothetical protein
MYAPLLGPQDHLHSSLFPHKNYVMTCAVGTPARYAPLLGPPDHLYTSSLYL